MLMLNHLHTDVRSRNRRYYPHQQTEIAKKAHDSIVSDLSSSICSGTCGAVRCQ